MSVYRNLRGVRSPFFSLATAAMLISTAAAWADGGVTFTDVAAGGENGLVYKRVPSANIHLFDQLTEFEVLTPPDWPLSPIKPHGAPGVAILDYDGDGDLDLYVTNGPGAANSLFSNQLVETGETTFVDVAAAAGVEATAQDSSGVCFGDTDNDGDPDLLVLSPFDGHRFFENNGDGTFSDQTLISGLAGGRSSIGCSFGDVDNDGLLDVVIGNTSVDMNNSLGIVVAFTFDLANDLYRNVGGNQFVDFSDASGVRNTTGFEPAGFDGSPTLTWAVALVDVDQDGDVDLVQADDQGGVLFSTAGGVDCGLIHVFQNDGTGQFTDLTGTTVPSSPGSWMGLSFGDINADGHLDLFSSNLGDWAATLLTPLDPVYASFAGYTLGALTSRWYLGGPGATFTDPGVGPLVATPFGWGTTMADYDNDADTDIVMHGGLYFGPVAQGSPGSILQNDGTGVFKRDVAALAGSTDHETRTVHGVAMGDLDRNGFVDVVSVSNFDLDPKAMTTYNHDWSSPFDGGRYFRMFVPTDGVSGNSVWSGIPVGLGSLSVELSSGGNGNRSVNVKTLGTVDLTTGGSVNRDGIGAVVEFRTDSGKTVLRPVLGGSSYASQDSLEGVFGLGTESFGRIEVLWPGGVRNRLYGVRAGERIVFPEIPCGYDGEFESLGEYLGCAANALDELLIAGVIDRGQRTRFLISALVARLRP